MGIVITNTSPLIVLGKIGRLDLIHMLFEGSRIIIPSEVFEEIHTEKIKEKIRELESLGKLIILPPGIKQCEKEVHHIATEIAMSTIKPDIRQRAPEQHYPESYVIHLGLTYKADFVVIDEKEAKTLAKQKGLRCVTHFDILVRCVENGLLTKKEGLDSVENLIKVGNKYPLSKIEHYRHEWESP